jgi:hydroxymethylbilane synthase
LVVIQTTGDVRSGPIGQLATRGVFTRQIQQALLDHQIDLAVHSLKDLPTEPIEGLSLAAVPHRGEVGDVLLTNAAESLAKLPAGARVGTGSLRRRAQLLHTRPDLQMLDVRGNVHTRLDKLQAGQFDALVLAEAGLERLGLADQIVERLDKALMLPAVGQGALGLEVRSDDQATRQVVQRLNDPPSWQAVHAERALLAQLRGGCLAPVGAWARFDTDRLLLDAVVLHPQGTPRLHVKLAGDGTEAVALGVRAAEQLLAEGAAEVIAASRGADASQARHQRPENSA